MNTKYQIDSIENKTFMKGLTDELLSFGHKFPSPGGSSYYLGDDGTPWTDRPRETWITCRMAHVYSIGTLLGHEGARELAQSAIKGLLGELHDEKSDGWYAGLTKDNTPLPNKQCYAHAFVILASTSGMLANIKGADELFNKAVKVYDEKFWDSSLNLAVDTWDTDFKVLDDYRGLNANMHTVEAFLAVADALSAPIAALSTTAGIASINPEDYRVRAGRIIDHVLIWAENNDYRIPEHFSKEWIPDLDCNKDRPADQFKPYGATPGHGIEWARLITQWTTSTFKVSRLGENAEADKYILAAINLYNRAIEDAWNNDGIPGIAYTTDWNGKPVVRDRMHWTLAEAINTSSILYRVTNDTKYSDDYSQFMKYLDDTVHDSINGSWFHQLDENNNVIGTVWPGKSDIYHALQATLIPYSKVDTSIAKAVSEM